MNTLTLLIWLLAVAAWTMCVLWDVRRRNWVCATMGAIVLIVILYTFNGAFGH